MAVDLALSAAGLVGLVAGLASASRLRRWTPRISPDLTDFDPGPDFLDWLRAAVYVVAGLTLLTLVLVG